MKTAIVYYSKHHGNTKKLLDAIAGADPAVVLNVCKTNRCSKGIMVIVLIQHINACSAKVYG